MADPCPFGHQLCSDLSACRITSAQVQAWYQQAAWEVPQSWPEDPKECEKLNPKQIEGIAKRANRERLNWVASQVAGCPQALPLPTWEERKARARDAAPRLPLG